MNKYLLFICTAACNILWPAITVGQTTTPDNRYIRYDEYYREIGKWLQAGKPEEMLHTTFTSIKAGAALLTDDKAPAKAVLSINGTKKVLNDEDIFAKRKNSVFIVGRLTSFDLSGTASINFDLMGTAFAISEDGACVTNYHVLSNIMRPKENEGKKDSLYFIITADKKIYFMEQILAFSQNNDLTIFRVNTRGDKLKPIPFGQPAEIGAPVYCLSHPLGHFYSFSKGIVARNVTIDTLNLGKQYNRNGKPPIRMEITADYGIGSSGGPILDKYGNLIGVVISTSPISYAGKDDGGKDVGFIQMMVKDTSPLQALTDLLKN